jgi:hypothetical protein
MKNFAHKAFFFNRVDSGTRKLTFHQQDFFRIIDLA